jgi:hypothetical protein
MEPFNGIVVTKEEDVGKIGPIKLTILLSYYFYNRSVNRFKVIDTCISIVIRLEILKKCIDTFV